MSLFDYQAYDELSIPSNPNRNHYDYCFVNDSKIVVTGSYITNIKREDYSAEMLLNNDYCEYYNMTNNQWTKLPNLNKRRI